MARFFDLTVTDVQKTIRDAVVVTLRPDPGAAEAFAFRHGQYLIFRRDFDGEELRRSYSICAGLDDGVLQVGIKKVDGGAFSTFANDDLRIGDRLSAMRPMGSFTSDLDPSTARTYLGFAGGSGIAPVLSILKTVLNREPNADFTLVYANRAVNSIMFREEIEDLKNTYMGRLAVVHVLESDAQDIDLFTGRVTEEKCAELFKHWIDVATVSTAFICGPEPMMLGIARALEAHGLEKSQIEFELFDSGQPGRAKRAAKSQDGAKAAVKTKISIALDGATHDVEVEKDITILDAALENALDAPYACKAGVCSTCRCKVLEGKAEMAANHALEDDEVSRGYILSCQAFPVTDRIVVDYDR